LLVNVAIVYEVSNTKLKTFQYFLTLPYATILLLLPPGCLAYIFFKIKNKVATTLAKNIRLQ